LVYDERSGFCIGEDFVEESGEARVLMFAVGAVVSDFFVFF